jgi:hypothetical protein
MFEESTMEDRQAPIVSDGDALQFYKSISANFRHFDEMYMKTSTIFGGFFAVYIGFVSAAFNKGKSFGFEVKIGATILVSVISVAMCLIMLRNREWLKLYLREMERVEERMGVTHGVGLFPTSIVLMITNSVLAVAAIIATLYFV